MWSPNDIVFDASGNFYITGTNNSAIRQVTKSIGYISTVAGITGTSGHRSPDRPTKSAVSDAPSNIALDESLILQMSKFWNKPLSVRLAFQVPMNIQGAVNDTYGSTLGNFIGGVVADENGSRNATPLHCLLAATIA